LAGKAREEQAKRMSEMNLIPKRINEELRRQDSMRHSKDSAYLLSKGYIKLIKDTIGLEDSEDDENIRKPKDDGKQKKKDSSKTIQVQPAILPDKQKTNGVDSADNKKP